MCAITLSSPSGSGFITGPSFPWGRKAAGEREREREVDGEGRWGGGGDGVREGRKLS